jgi:hypothetical protein
MDLIDRYLAAVRRELPPEQQDDIVQELRDSLRSEAEELESRAGRALGEDEQAALLKKRGHPWLMAARYLTQQYLIGPHLYPYYRKTLGMVVFWVVLPIVLIGGAISSIYSDRSLAGWLSHVIPAAWNGAVYSVGIVTIVFAILEHERVRVTVLDSWNPQRLPDPDEGVLVPRSESVFGLVFSLTVLIWWTDVVRAPNLIFFDSEPARIVPGPMWAPLYWPILLSLVAAVGIHLIDMIRPWRTTAVTLADIAIGLVNLGIVWYVLRANNYVQVQAPVEFLDKAARAEYYINNTIMVSFAVIGSITAWEVLTRGWRLLRARPSRLRAIDA